MLGAAAGPAYRSMASSDSARRSSPPDRDRTTRGRRAPDRWPAGSTDGRSSRRRRLRGRRIGADPKSRTEAGRTTRRRVWASWSRASRMDDRPGLAWPARRRPRGPRRRPGPRPRRTGCPWPMGTWTGDGRAGSEMTDAGWSAGAGIAPAASEGGYRMSNLTSDSPVPPPRPARPGRCPTHSARLGAVYTGSSPGRISDVSPVRRRGPTPSSNRIRMSLSDGASTLKSPADAARPGPPLAVGGSPRSSWSATARSAVPAGRPAGSPHRPATATTRGRCPPRWGRRTGQSAAGCPAAPGAA